MVKYLFICLIGLLPVIAVTGQETKTRVLLLGCFHFDNPGLDVAKFKNADILSAQRQREVQELNERLLKFRPDKIFVEVPAERQLKLDSSFNRYKFHKAPLTASETHQVGYRLAAELQLPGLYAVDYRDSHFPFDSLMKSAVDAGQTHLTEGVKRIIDSIQNNFNNALTRYSIRELLIRQNSPSARQGAVGIYFDFLAAGKPGNHVGSYLTSEWWRRNMIIYENILKKLDGKEKNILVIFGSGHTALLELMMSYNRNLEVVKVEDVLK